jgi:tRNA threonylcarbamoyladenosine biosynthesis protein TsaB
MALILSLETSTDVCSVALHRNGALVKETIVHESQAHASRLAPIIDEIFALTSLSIDDLSAVAVAAGPGSYTGLRIGTSTAKGICYALQIPLISVGTLNVIAKRAAQQVAENSLICPMIDARRMEVYCQIFTRELTTISDVEAKIIDSDSFSELLKTHRVFFTGNGAAKCKTFIKSHNAFFLDGIFPTASELGFIANGKFLQEKFEDLAAFEPFYLKQFEAKKSQSLLF